MATLKEEKNKKSKKSNIEKIEMLELFKQMYLIRQFELACGENYTKGNIRGFLHLYIGQEATAVGSISCLNDEDYIITHYRDHGHALARGLDVNRSMSELLVKKRVYPKVRVDQCTSLILLKNLWEDMLLLEVNFQLQQD